jgi:hypothetical protein
VTAVVGAAEASRLARKVARLIPLARFSGAFRVLRGPQVGIDVVWMPLVMVAANLDHAATAHPFGPLADRISLGRFHRLSARNAPPPCGATVVLPCHARARGGS